MGAQVVGTSSAENVLHGFEWPHAPAAHVGALLDRDQARARRVAVLRVTHRRLDLGAGEDPRRRFDLPGHRPVHRRRATCLKTHRVRVGGQDHLVPAGAQMQPEGYEVAHRAAGQEQAGLMAQQIGHALLQAQRGGIGELLLVADLGGGHGGAHRLGGPRLGVRDQVDRRHGAQPASSRRSAAIFNTASAASTPWWRLPPPERASACSIVFTVSTPKAHGTPVSSDTRAIPRAASPHT